MSEKPSGGGLRERRCVRVGGMVAVVCGDYGSSRSMVSLVYKRGEVVLFIEARAWWVVTALPHQDLFHRLVICRPRSRGRHQLTARSPFLQVEAPPTMINPTYLAVRTRSCTLFLFPLFRDSANSHSGQLARCEEPRAALIPGLD
jgi:hypothetical protein